jgi:hypothetical protein
MVAYNERVLATSSSPRLREEARRMLVNLRPHVVRLETQPAAAVAAERAPVIAGPVRHESYEVVWSGAAKRVSLTGDHERREA